MPGVEITQDGVADEQLRLLQRPSQQTIIQQARNQTSMTAVLVLMSYGCEQVWPGATHAAPLYVQVAATALVINVLTILGNVGRNIAKVKAIARWIG